MDRYGGNEAASIEAGRSNSGSDHGRNPFRFPGDFSVGHVAGRFRQRSIAMDDGRSFRESCAAEIVRNDRRVTMLNQVNQGREFDGANCPLLALTGTCLPKIADITLWFQQRTWH